MGRFLSKEAYICGRTQDVDDVHETTFDMDSETKWSDETLRGLNSSRIRSFDLRLRFVSML
jgi:hypothetical protein